MQAGAHAGAVRAARAAAAGRRRVCLTRRPQARARTLPCRARPRLHTATQLRTPTNTSRKPQRQRRCSQAAVVCLRRHRRRTASQKTLNCEQMCCDRKDVSDVS